MTNTLSTKRALLISTMALILCFTMLLGTTFAWFTDSVTSTGNKIQAGTLKIDLALYNTETGAFDSIKTSKAPIFDYDLWEPGYTDVKLLKVENEGTLALKWKATIVGVDVNSILADVIDVYVLPIDASANPDDAAAIATLPADRTLAGFTPAGTLAEFVAGVETTTVGKLNPKDAEGDTAYLCIALKMQESADNRYQGLSLGSFDIQILATQLNYESDSFDENYDANLEPEASGVEQILADGSTAFYYDENSGAYGRVRLTALPENVGSEYTVPSEVNDLGGALKGTTLDKLTIHTGVEYAYKSLEGATIDEIVIEDGATTIPDRMFYKTNVGSVEIPSTVTVIEQNAFAMASVVEELVIPASVVTVEEAAFQHMTNLKTVTFEGNTSIQGYAFRGCSNLRTVYLKGDDTTFIASTLNGRNSCWFCNGESNNPNTSNITFHVENETVATRVKTAMGAEANNTPVYINGTLFVMVKNLSELQTALNNATVDTIINITANITGDATVYQKENADLVINGQDNILTGHLFLNGRSAATSPETLTIKNLTVTSDYYLNNGEVALINAYYEPTSGTGATRNVHNVTIENCDFIATGADAKKIPAIDLYQPFGVTVKDCTVTGAHSAIQVKGGQDVDVINLTTTDCKNGISFGTTKWATISDSTINSVVGGGYGLRTDASDAYELTVSNCTVSAFVPVLARKQTGTGYKLTFEGTNTLNATNTYGYQVVLTNTDWDDDAAAPTAPTGTSTVTGADTFSVYNG